MTSWSTSIQNRPRFRSREPFGDLVAARVAKLQIGYVGARQDPATVALLARLRHGVGREPGAMLNLGETTALPAEFLPNEAPDEPTVHERAMHMAVTLWAVHQQSQSQLAMHRDGPGIGVAVRLLAYAGPNSEAVERRFAALGTAQSFAELTYHARSLITLLRGKSIAMDYGLFADDLVTYLSGPYGPTKVRGLWGRDYHRTITKQPDSSKDES